MKTYKNKTMTFDVEDTINAIDRAREQGGWLVLYDHGADIDHNNPITTSLIHCESSGDIESYAGGVLIFLDSWDFEDSVDCDDWKYILSALYNNECLPKLSFLEEFINEEELRNT